MILRFNRLTACSSSDMTTSHPAARCFMSSSEERKFRHAMTHKVTIANTIEYFNYPNSPTPHSPCHSPSHFS